MKYLINRLDNEAQYVLTEAKKYDIGSKEYGEHISIAMQLARELNDLEKNDLQREKDERQELLEKSDRKWRRVIDILAIAVPSMISIGAIVGSFMFDSEGKMFTSTIGKSTIIGSLPKSLFKR